MGDELIEQSKKLAAECRTLAGGYYSKNFYTNVRRVLSASADIMDALLSVLEHAQTKAEASRISLAATQTLADVAVAGALQWKTDFEKVQAENARLKSELAWYADEYNYDPQDMDVGAPDMLGIPAYMPGPSRIDDDGGVRARRALEQQGQPLD